MDIPGIAIVLLGISFIAALYYSINKLSEA